MDSISDYRSIGGTNAVTQSRIRPVVEEGVKLLQAEKAPLTRLFREFTSKSIPNVKFSWHLDELPPKSFVTTAQSLAASGTVTAAAADLAFVNIGDMLKNLSTGEQLYVTAKPSSTTVTVTRSAGETAAADIASGGTLINMGHFAPEGGELVVQATTKETEAYNYLQIWRDAIATTGTAEAMNKAGFYGEGDWKLQNRKVMLKHLRDINTAGYHGDRGRINVTDVDAVAGKDLRQTGGADFFIPSTNVTSTATLTSIDLDDFTVDAFFHGDASEYIFMVGANILSTLRNAMNSAIEYRSGDTVHGLKVKKIATNFGDLDLVYDAYGLDHNVVGLGGRGYLLKKSELSWHELRPTQLLKGRGSNGKDGVTDELLTEAGFGWGDYRKHSLIKGVTRPTNA